MSKTRKLADGLARCSWVTDDQIYIEYHDNEWGQANRNQRDLFEAICLEGFQAGLSWLTILKRREGFRASFDNFETSKVSKYGKRDINRLMKNPAIIRNKAKIASAINNAQIVEEQGLDLVEISATATPPVCKIIDYNKFLYDQKKKQKEIKAKAKTSEVKEVRFTPNTDDHDFEFKCKHAEKFLQDGNKVKAHV